MSEVADGNIVSLGGREARSVGKAEFLRVLGGHFDAFVERFGREPEALSFVLASADGDVVPAWLMRERCEGSAPAQIALASVVLSWGLRDTGS